MVFAFSVSIMTADAYPPNIPMGLYGDVKIGGSSAKADTIIEGKAGSQVVASTKVVNAGKYGDIGNFLGIYAASEGDDVDIFVNDVYVTTVKYVAGKSTRVDLNVQSTQPGDTSGNVDTSGNPDRSGNGGGSGGGGNVTKKGTATPTASQMGVSTKESVSSTQAATETTGKPDTPGSATFQFYSIMGIFVLLVIGAIIISALKKGGKI